MSKASKEALDNLPANTTECPFVPLFSGNKRKYVDDTAEGGSFFWGEDAKRPKTGIDVPKKGYVCKRCNVPGHYIKDCPEQPVAKVPEGYVCNICKKPDHFIRDCPDRQQQREPREQPKCKSIVYNNEIKMLTMKIKQWTRVGSV
jgi:hypothetical protein